MTRADAIDEYRSAVKRLADLADEVAAERSHDKVLDALADVRVAVARVYQGKRLRPEPGSSARTRILAYLLKHMGEWVSSEEIAAVSGIGEWARRVRELRLEQGYEIEEGGGRYRILAEERNLARRNRWRTVTAIRNREGSPLERVQELFEALVGEVVTLEEINRVSHGKDGPGMARQLRDRELLPIETSADAPDLGPGDHRLASVHEWDRLHSSQALFTEDLRRQVFSRDRFICRTCRIGRSASGTPVDRAFYLVVRHLDAPPDALPRLQAERLTDLGRLATWCNRCAVKGDG